MTIYLHYITHDDGKRMRRDAFVRICAWMNWDTFAIQSFMLNNGFTFDKDYGFTFQEVIDTMKIRFDYETVQAQKHAESATRMQGFNEACEGRR